MFCWQVTVIFCSISFHFGKRTWRPIHNYPQLFLCSWIKELLTAKNCRSRWGPNLLLSSNQQQWSKTAGWYLGFFICFFPTWQLVHSRWWYQRMLISQLPLWEDLSQSTDGSPPPPRSSPPPTGFSRDDKSQKFVFNEWKGTGYQGRGGESRVQRHSPACIWSAAREKQSSTSKYTTLKGVYRLQRRWAQLLHLN